MARVRLMYVERLGRLKSRVPMNENDIVIFGEEGKFSLATVDLNSCHAVAIVSKKAAILAHIAPLPPFKPNEPSQSFFSSEAWIKYKLDEVIQRFEDNRVNFENQGSVDVLVFELWKGEIALPDQVEYIAANIEKVTEVAVTTKPYHVLEDTEPRTFNKCVVIIEGLAIGHLPRVWVEDDQIPLLSVASSSTGSTNVASSTI